MEGKRIKVKNIIGKVGGWSRELVVEVKQGSDTLTTEKALRMQASTWDIGRNVMDKTINYFNVKDNYMTIQVK